MFKFVLLFILFLPLIVYAKYDSFYSMVIAESNGDIETIEYNDDLNRKNNYNLTMSQLSHVDISKLLPPYKNIFYK